MERAKSGIAGGERIEDGGGAIRAAVVDEEDLVRATQRVKRRADPLAQGAGVSLLVMQRDHDRKLGLAWIHGALQPWPAVRDAGRASTCIEPITRSFLAQAPGPC